MNSNCLLMLNSIELSGLRKHLVLPRRADEAGGSTAATRLDSVECVLQRCSDCKDLQILFNGLCGMCDEEIRDPNHG